MNQPDDVATPPEWKRSRWLSSPKRLLFWIGVALLLLFLVYLGGANWLLRSESGQAFIASLSKNTQVEWQGAWTVLPGVVHLDTLTVSGGKQQRWALEAKEVDATVSLLSLVGRAFTTRRVSVNTLSVRIDRSSPDIESTQVAGSTSTESVTSGSSEASAAPPPSSPPPSAPTARGPGRWSIHIRGAEVAHFESLRLGEIELSGDGQVGGAFHFRIRGNMRLDDLTLDMPDAELHHGDDLLAEIPVLRLRGDIGDFAPRGADPRQVLQQVTADIELEAHTRSLGFLNSYVSKAEWLAFEGGIGTLEAQLSLDRGIALPGSRLAFDGTELGVALLDYRIAGTPTLGGHVDEQGVQLDFRFADYGFRSEGADVPYLTGETLTLGLRTPEADIAGTPDFDFTLDLEDGEVPDFRVFNSFFESLDSLELLSGSATIDTHLALTTREGVSPEASLISIEGEDIELRYGNLDVLAKLLMTSRITAARPARRSFDIGHIAVVIDEATLYQQNEEVAHDWHGEIFLIDGQLTLARPLEAEATLELAMSDARPLLAVFAEKKPRVDLIGRVLRLTDLTGSAELAVGPNGIAMDQIDIDAKDLEIEGRICLENEQRRGILHAVVRGIGVAASLDGGGQKFSLFNSRRWYEQRLPSVVCASH